MAAPLVFSILIANASPCGIGESYALQSRHGQLQTTLETGLRRAGLGQYLDRRTLGVSLVDLSIPNQTLYAGINDNVMMYAASLPKIAILLSVTRAASRGKFPWNATTRKRLKRMIVASNNADASWGAETVGLKAIAADMRDPRHCFYDMQHGGLWVGRAFRKGSPTNRDPLENLSHAASARQAARFYLLLEREMLVSPYYNSQMLDLMAPPAHFHKFVGGLKDRTGVRFDARKSGTWRTAHSDSAIIQHYAKRYILVGVMKDPAGERVMRRLSRIVDDLVLEGRHRRRS